MHLECILHAAAGQPPRYSAESGVDRNATCIRRYGGGAQNSK
jgi:hypothetical protein